MKRNNVQLEFHDLLIADLVPGEPLLNRAAVVDYGSKLQAGEPIEPPRVICFDGLYYIRDGSHRVMAHKLAGLKTVRCAVQAARKSKGVADFDKDSFEKFLAAGLRGLENVELVESEAKGRAHAEEEELFDGLDGLTSDSVTCAVNADLNIPDDDFFD